MGPPTTRFPASVIFSILFSLAPLAFGQTINCAGGESLVSFEAIGRPSMLTIRGKSDKPLHGALKIDGQKVSGSCSFDIETLSTGMAMRDDHMKHKYLESQKFPNANLTITKLALPAPLSGDKIPFEGELELHGEKQNIQGTASFTPQSDKEAVMLHYELQLGDYGISQPKFSGITIGKIITVDVSLTAPVSK